MTPPTTNSGIGTAGLARDAAAPLLLLAALAAAVLATSTVWVAAGIAALLGTGIWTTPAWSLALLPRLLTDGVPALVGPTGSYVGFFAALTTLVVAAVGAAAVGWRRARPRRDPAIRSLLRGHQLGDLTGHAAHTKAVELRPNLTTTSTTTASGSAAGDQAGIRVGRLDGHDVWMSWEDVALIILGPRSNKTSALAVPAVRSAPGLAVATSNKADLWALTSGARAELGAVWVFDPQDIAYHPQQWWWDPLRAIREVPDPHRVEAATRLAGHFMATIGGTRRDPFFHAAGEQVLTGTLLAAALDPDASLREVVDWLQHGRRDAIIALDTAGAEIEAADLHACGCREPCHGV